MIRYADMEDFTFLHQMDSHVTEAVLCAAITAKQVIVLLEQGRIIGWLRYNLFWDNIPFMNMLYLLDGYRGKGYGSRLVCFWEQEMVQRGYPFVLTSTQSNETAQFFYRKIGYVDCGTLLLPKEPMELLLYKPMGGTA